LGESATTTRRRWAADPSSARIGHLMRRLPGFAPVIACALAACSRGAKANPPPPRTCAGVPASATYPSAYLAAPHACMITLAQSIISARQLAVAPNGDILVAGGGQVVVLFDSNGDGVSDASERTTFATVPGGNHGLAITATHVYASSATTVYRWPYTAGDRV